MKKKIIFAVATGLFALATIFNMNVLQSNNAGDLSLEAIAVMAQAQDELSGVVPSYEAEQQRLKDLMSNEWYTDFYMPAWLAECTLSICDDLDITGDPVYVDEQYPNGEWHTVLENECDGQPSFC
ncbi:hypothetical protein ACT3CD_11445 [Geofilum sp. OHC36d9]|uniref:hypothetical protein n=1 Tax=Geofilum sp. OHC36d9 TaxID=3458413 RepID=UPI0040342676